MMIFSRATISSSLFIAKSVKVVRLDSIESVVEIGMKASWPLMNTKTWGSEFFSGTTSDPNTLRIFRVNCSNEWMVTPPRSITPTRAWLACM